MKNKEIHFVDKVVEALKKSATELEAFQVNMALGKAEAHDKYEVVKKKFNSFIHDSKFEIKEVKEKIDELDTKFDELRVQLALGKAETKDVFLKQKKLLLKTIHAIEVKIKTNESLNKLYALTLIEIEQFKIKLHILEQKFNEEDTPKINDSFNKSIKDFYAFVDKFHAKHTSKKETKLAHFQNEISEAFDHFKNAFSKP